MPADLSAILTLHVPVIVQIGRRTMPLADVLSLVPGAIIELPKAIDEELELLVNNKVIGTGQAVKVGENFGLRVKYVGDLSHRLHALVGDGPEAKSDGSGGIPSVGVPVPPPSLGVADPRLAAAPAVAAPPVAEAA